MLQVRLFRGSQQQWEEAEAAALSLASGYCTALSQLLLVCRNDVCGNGNFAGLGIVPLKPHYL